MTNNRSKLIPHIGQEELAEAVENYGIPACNAKRIASGMTLGRLVQAVGPKLIGMATVMEVIETTRKEIAEIDKLSGSVEPDQEAELVKLRYNLLRVRLEAGKALMAADLKTAASSDRDEKPEKFATPQPGELVGINTEN